jgi:hypothetical protein
MTPNQCTRRIAFKKQLKPQLNLYDFLARELQLEREYVKRLVYIGPYTKTQQERCDYERICAAIPRFQK